MARNGDGKPPITGSDIGCLFVALVQAAILIVIILMWVWTFLQYVVPDP